MKIRKLGIRAQIFLGFSLFTVIIVLILWFFQIGLLNNFYRAIKYNETQNTAQKISENLDDEDLVEILKEITIKTSTDILIADERGMVIMNVSNAYSNSFQNLTPVIIAGIYQQTLENDGEIVQWSEGSNTANYESLLYLKIATTEDGASRLIVLNAVVTPVTAAVETLQVQLICVTIVMGILSTLLAMFISRKLSRPISSINETAKLLAQGEYNVMFDQGGSREINELANTLNYASYELSKVETLRRELIANVSHDLRTPLTMISGYGEVMRDIPGENSPENVQIIIEEAERLKNLVNDLLDISKLEAGQIVLENDKVNLTQSIVAILRRYDKLADFNFDFYHGEDIYVIGDEIKLSQVVYNLVNNAINYTGEDKRVILKQIVQGDRVIIQVIDTGEGIPEDKIKDIWERYYKVDKSHKRAAIGTGLGLSIVKNVIELHGGTYGVESELGQGCMFWFSLTKL